MGGGIVHLIGFNFCLRDSNYGQAVIGAAGKTSGGLAAISRKSKPMNDGYAK